MIITKTLPKKEVELFLKKFKGTTISYEIEYTINGDIIKCNTENQEIINYMKNLGLKNV